MDLDLDINSYSIDELYSILRINKGCDESYIRDCVLKTIDMLHNSISDKNSMNEYELFFYKLQDKLIEELNKNTNTQIINNSNTSPEKNSITGLKTSYQDLLVKPEFALPINVFNNKFPQDNLNPIKRETVKSVISIDTLFRDPKFKPYDFVFYLNTPLKNVVSMELMTVELPNVWYSFSENNQSNIFYLDMFNMNNGSGSFFNQTYTIHIPSGNYTPTEFKKMLNNLFYSISSTEGPSLLTADISVRSGNVVLRVNNVNNTSDVGPDPYDPTNPFYAPDFYYKIRFDIENTNNRPLYYNAGWMMGFRESSYTVRKTDTYTDSITNVGSITYKGFLESEGYYGSGISTYVFIEIEDYNKNYRNNFISVNENIYIMDNVIGRISLTTGSNTINVNTGTGKVYKKREYFGPVTIDKLRIRLIDKYGQPLDINDNNYSLSLEVTQLYS